MPGGGLLALYNLEKFKNCLPARNFVVIYKDSILTVHFSTASIELHKITYKYINKQQQIWTLGQTSTAPQIVVIFNLTLML